jgi:hypothetical protein
MKADDPNYALIPLMYTAGATISGIANTLHVGDKTVTSVLDEQGVSRRPSGPIPGTASVVPPPVVAPLRRQWNWRKSYTDYPAVGDIVLDGNGYRRNAKGHIEEDPTYWGKPVCTGDRAEWEGDVHEVLSFATPDGDVDANTNEFIDVFPRTRHDMILETYGKTDPFLIYKKRIFLPDPSVKRLDAHNG